MHQLLYRIAELERRMSNLIRHGRIDQLCQQPSPRAKVRSEGLVTDWLPWLTQRAGADRVWWQPTMQEQVLLLAPAGDLSQAIILPALWSEQTVAPNAAPNAVAPSTDPKLHRIQYQDGTLIDYHREEHRWTLDLRAAERGRCQIYSDQLTTDGQQIAMTATESVVITAASLTLRIGSQELCLDSSGATLTAAAINLGGSAGKGVARIGDTVLVGGGSSAGSWPIVSGSAVVRAG